MTLAAMSDNEAPLQFAVHVAFTHAVVAIVQVGLGHKQLAVLALCLHAASSLMCGGTLCAASGGLHSKLSTHLPCAELLHQVLWSCQQTWGRI